MNKPMEASGHSTCSAKAEGHATREDASPEASATDFTWRATRSGERKLLPRGVAFKAMYDSYHIPKHIARMGDPT